MIHKTAVIGPRVRMGEGCEIGPYCVVDGDVELGAGNRLTSHVYIEGKTFIGNSNTFFPFSCIGVIPQDLKYKNEDSGVRIGHGNSIRENVTIHRGTLGGRADLEKMTCIGDHNLIMAYTHIAHDCVLGDHIVLANATQLAGHVEIQDYVRLGGVNIAVQFVRIGAHAFTGAGSIIRKDIPPYVLGSGEPIFTPSGINKVGLERQGISSQVVEDLKNVFHIFYRAGRTQSEALKEIQGREWKSAAEVKRFIDFVLESKVGVSR